MNWRKVSPAWSTAATVITPAAAQEYPVVDTAQTVCYDDSGNAMDPDTRNYLVVTGGYWDFTLTDGAIRMLVVLYFHLLGYSPFEVAMLFLFYEFFGIVTNLVGGWLGARIGLNLTMHIGMGLQVVALGMLTVPDAWLSVPYVMAAQALSGIAKDLNKMSAKASVKSAMPPMATTPVPLTGSGSGLSENAKPCVLMIDEVEKGVGERVESLHDFKEVLRLEHQPAGWTRDEEVAPRGQGGAEGARRPERGLGTEGRRRKRRPW